MLLRVNDPGTEIPLASGVPSMPFGFDPDVVFVEIEVTAEDGVTERTYLIVIFRGAPTGLQTYVKASNTGSIDWFGTSVATSGNTVVVGAQFESSDSVGVNGSQDNDGA